MAGWLQWSVAMSLRQTCFASVGMILVASSVGCGGPGYRRDFLGRSGASVTTSQADDTPSTNSDGSMPAVALGGPSGAPGAGGITVHAGDELEVAWTIRQPHAEKLRYAISCAGVAMAPVEIGESQEEYRARRIAEIRAELERDRAVLSSVASALVPGVAAQGQVATPNAQGTVEVGVDRHAVGDAVAAGVIKDDIHLTSDDVGGGTLTGTLHVNAVADGTCGMTVYTDTPGVAGTIAVTRVVDVGRERRARDDARREVALAARGQITASLYEAGAQDRQIVVPEVEVAAPVEVAATARVDTSYDQSLGIRGSYIAYLVGECHADPHAREKAEEQERARIAMRLRLALDLRARLHAQLVAYGADPAYRVRAAAEAAALAASFEAAETTARSTRLAMMDFLIALGASLRPPMPAPLNEDPGSEPFVDALWIAGQWIWLGGEWQWQAGGWRDGSGGFSTDTTVSNDDSWTTRDHRTDGNAGWTSRDHRTDDGAATIKLGGSSNAGSGSGSTTVRDHRRNDRDEHTSSSTITRDHRTSSDDNKKHDKRDDRRDDKKDDDKPRNRDDDRAGNVVRDHRR